MSVPLNGKRKARQLLRSERRKSGVLSHEKADSVIKGIQNGIIRDAKRKGEQLSALGLRVKTAEVLDKWKKVGNKK